MIKQKLKSMLYWPSIITLGMILGISLQFAKAWTEPSAPPPGGNVSPPLNTNINWQVKSGGLGTGYSEIIHAGEPTLNFHRPGFFATGIKLRGDNNLWLGGWSTGEGTAGVVAGRMYDGDDTGYNLDPNGTSRLNYGVYNNIYNHGWVQSSYFLDANDNGYYVDPNSGSRFNYGVYDNIYSYGWMQSQYFVDANDNGYYVDPNNGSRLNYVLADNTHTYGNENANDYYIRASGKWASQLGGLTYVGSCTTTTSASNDVYCKCNAGETMMMMQGFAGWGNWGDKAECNINNQNSGSVQGHGYYAASLSGHCTFACFR